MTFHPAIYDHWSAELLLGELSTLYDAAVQNREPTELAPLPFQLVDLAHWQQGLLQNHAFDRRIAFWKSYLKTPLHQLRIPADRYPGRSTAGIEVPLNVPQRALQGIRTAATRWKTSPQVIYMTAYAAVLSRRYRQHEVIVKVPTPARTEETLHTAGAITESTWIRVSVPRKTAFETLVVQNTQSYDKAMQHELPLGLLFEVLEQDASELEKLSWAALNIGDAPLPGGANPRPFGQASFEPLALGATGRVTMPVDSHSILSLWVNELGALEGTWACKQSMMSENDLKAMAMSLERILIAVSKSLNEGPSLEDTVELRAMTGTHGLSSSHVFSRGSTQPSETRDLSHQLCRAMVPGLKTGCSVQLSPRWAPRPLYCWRKRGMSIQIQDLLVETSPLAQKIVHFYADQYGRDNDAICDKIIDYFLRRDVDVEESKREALKGSQAILSFYAERFSRAPNEILDTILVEFTRYDPDFNASVFGTTLTESERAEAKARLDLRIEDVASGAATCPMSGATDKFALRELSDHTRIDEWFEEKVSEYRCPHGAR